MSADSPMPTGRALTAAEQDFLNARGWPRYVGRSRGLWVRLPVPQAPPGESPGEQRLLVVEDGRVLHSYPCSAAKAGIGNVRNSGCTPAGWHEVRQKIGAGLPPGAVLKGRRWTGAILAPGQSDGEDHILSRILRLAGLEDGLNRGGDVDTWDRLIYVHGTADERNLGRAASHGCIRLSTRDVIELFNLVEVGCRLLIAEE